MALAITDRGFARTTGGSSATNTVTSASFAGVAGSLIVVCAFLGINDGTGATSALSLTDTFAGTSAWTKITAASRLHTVGSGSALYSNLTEMWYAVLGGTPGTGTITVTRTAGTKDQWLVADFIQVTGQDTSPLGTTGSTTGAATTQALTMLVTPAATSLVIAYISDDTNPNTNIAVPPTGFTELNDIDSAGWGSAIETCYDNTSAPQTFTWTGLVANTHDAVAVEIVVLGGGAAPSPSAAIIQRPEALPQDRRRAQTPFGRLFVPTPAVTITPPVIAPSPPIPVRPLPNPIDRRRGQPPQTRLVGKAGSQLPFVAGVSGRHFVDQYGNPLFINMQSAWALCTELTVAEMDTYMAAAAARGFNAIGTYLINGFNESGFKDTTGATYDSIIPFVGADFTTPTAAYWDRMDVMFATAAAYGLTVFAFPAEHQVWGPKVISEGAAHCTSYGTFLGNRYKGVKNIVWGWGDDYANTDWTAEDPRYKNIADAIIAAGDTHLHGLHTMWFDDPSYANSAWDSYVLFNTCYTYTSTYDSVRTAYAHSPTKPCGLIEGGYFLESLQSTAGTRIQMRHQTAWTLLEGATFVAYGHRDLWQISLHNDATHAIWSTQLNTADQNDVGRMVAKFETLDWTHLVPDTGTTFITSGRGTYSAGGTPQSGDYCGVARTGDGLLAVVYMPTSRSFTLNTGLLSGTVTGYWFDPSNGSTVTYSGATHPGNNAAGDGDWFLILTADGLGNPSPGTINSVTSFGAVVITATAVVTPTTIQSVTSFGAPTVSIGVTVTPTTIQSVTSFGTPTVTADAAIAPSTIQSVTSFGTVVIQVVADSAQVIQRPPRLPQDRRVPVPFGRLFVGAPVPSSPTVTPSTIQSTTSFGVPAVTATAVVTPTTIQSVTSMGATTILTGTVISPSTINSTTSFGAPSITATAVITPTTIQSVTTFGSVTIVASALIVPSTIQSVTSFGAPTINVGSGGTAAPSTINSVTTFGSAAIIASALVAPSTINSVTSFGAAVVKASATIVAATINSVTTFGSTTITASVVIVVGTIQSVTSFGAPTVTAGSGATVTPATISSVTTFGAVVVKATAVPTPTTILSQTTLGLPSSAADQRAFATTIFCVTIMAIVRIQPKLVPPLRFVPTGTLEYHFVLVSTSQIRFELE